jgi:hypothetical protein
MIPQKIQLTLLSKEFSLIHTRTIEMARSSTIHSSSFESKLIEPKQLTESRSFLESAFAHTHIRNVLQLEKSEDFLSNEKLLLIGNEGRTEPGFLCFLPKKPVQFLHCRLDQGKYLRLRVDSSLFDKGTVFIATFELGIVTLQDCWMWKGESLLQQPFSKRFPYVHTFLQSYIVKDPKLSGVELQAVTLHPLTALQSLIQSEEYLSIDFVPENPRRRRCSYRIEQRVAKPKPAMRPPPNGKHVLAPRPPVEKLHLKPRQPVGELVAVAKNIQGLPDTFDLFSYDRKHIGEAAVQEEEISFLLRKQLQSTSSLLVVVEWNSFLDAYEIKKIAPKGSRIAQFVDFTNASAQQKPEAEGLSSSEYTVDGDTDEYDNAVPADTVHPTSGLRGE